MNKLASRMFRPQNWARAALVLALLAFPFLLESQYAAPQKADADAAAFAERIEAAGLPNLGRVSEQLYRGAQPEEEGWARLKEMGIEIVVNLRDEDDHIVGERGQVEALGMRYISIPWSGYRYPDNSQVADFLALLRADPEKKVFVHCRRGAERTGVMVAAYRISAQNWSAGQALDEMDEFKFRGFWFRHLKNYVRGFGGEFQQDPAFTPLRTPATAASPPE